MICACMRCCCSSITRIAPPHRCRRWRGARRSSCRASPRRRGRRSTTGPSWCGSPASTATFARASGDQQQRIGRLRRLVDDDAVEHRVAEQRVIAADAGREHDLGALDDRALARSRARARRRDRARAPRCHSAFGLGRRGAPAALLRSGARRSRHSRASRVAPSASTCASSVSAASAGETRAGMAEPHRADAAPRRAGCRGCRPRCSTAPRTARARRAHALAHDLDERARLAGARRAVDQRDVAGAQRGVDGGALAVVERRRRTASSVTGASGRAGRDERRDVAEPREIASSRARPGRARSPRRRGRT